MQPTTPPLSGSAAVDNSIGAIIAEGLKDPTCRFLLVVAVIACVGFILHMKYYRPSRLAELATKKDIEASRAQQTQHIKDTASTQERATTSMHAALDRIEAHAKWMEQQEPK